MLSVIVFLIFLLVFILAYLFLNSLFKDKIKVLLRLEKIKGKSKEINPDLEELNVSFFERVIKPIADNTSNIISKITPTGMKTRIEDELKVAGYPYNLSINQWFLIRLLLSIILPLILIIIAIINNILISRMFFGIIIAILIFNLFPRLFIKQYKNKRQKEIVKTLPDVLDLLTVSVEAGLSFDGALSRLVEKMPGVLADEFSKVLNEMRIGKSRREALRDMSERCKVSDLTTLVGSLIQADELGVGVSKVLRVQSVQMREKRRQRAQEKAMKAPVKILFPLIFFIFPTIFAVLLGPAVIKMMNTFGN
ncbi:MAG: type II secretion system F family protein [Firmicutes bacterium]|nr:type II secretion system F family protein [Bacillota bacterium]